MKKVSLVLCLLTLYLFQLVAAPCGDVDSSGIVNVVDALLMAQKYVGLDVQTFNETVADVNGDKMVNIVDALLIAKFYVKIIPSLDGCKEESTTPGGGPSVTQKPMEPETLFAVNCGGSAYTGSDSTKYDADKGYSGGSDYESGGLVSGTSDASLYASERYGDSSYSVAVPNGEFSVTLHFAENYHTAAGQRVFNVNLEGRQVISNLDVVATAGAKKAHVVEKKVKVSDGELNIDFVSITENALINAIKVDALSYTGEPIVKAIVTPSMAKPGETVKVDASASVDPDGSIASYKVDYGDGYVATTAVSSHTYTEGKYVITVTVTDNEGNTSSLTKKITIADVVVYPPETPAGMGFDPFPSTVVVTKVKHFDNSCWKIAMAGGTWYFENGETNGKSGFNSAFDQVGNDWIGNDADRGYNKSSSSGGKHEYRGWPNFGEGNFDHPQRSSGAKTKWIDESGNEIKFEERLEGDHLIMRSYNSRYEVEYHFFPSHASIKVIKASGKYAFLFEGPIGGEQESAVEKDHYVLDDGQPRKLNRTGGGLGYIDPEFGSKKQFPSPFFYLVDTDPKDTQVLYVGAKNLGPSHYGDEGWRQGSNMVIFSYGRKNDKRSLTGTEAVCVFGFLPKSYGHSGISDFITKRLADPFTGQAMPE